MYNGYIQILHKTLSFSFYFPPEEIHKVVAAIFLLSEWLQETYPNMKMSYINYTLYIVWYNWHI